jgi:hypothetical protein
LPPALVNSLAAFFLDLTMKKKFTPQDFGVAVVDKDFLNKDGSLKIRRGYKNKYKALDEKHGIKWYHTVYSSPTFGFYFVIDGHKQRGSFHAFLNLSDNTLVTKYADDSIILSKEKFLQKMENHKIFFEWCLWNLG